MLGSVLKDIDGRFICPVEKKLASPIKQILLGWIHVSSGLEFVRRRYKFSIFLLELAQQVVQLRRVLLLHDGLDKLPRLAQPSRKKIGQRQIVAVVVGGRINALRLFEERNCFCEFSGLNVELTEVVVGVKIPRLQR